MVSEYFDAWILNSTAFGVPLWDTKKGLKTALGERIPSWDGQQFCVLKITLSKVCTSFYGRAEDHFFVISVATIFVAVHKGAPDPPEDRDHTRVAFQKDKNSTHLVNKVEHLNAVIDKLVGRIFRDLHVRWPQVSTN